MQDADEPVREVLQIVAAWPNPGAPQCTMRPPMTERTGSAVAKSSSFAPTTPSETGASMLRNPITEWPAATWVGRHRPNYVAEADANYCHGQVGRSPVD